MKVRTLTLLYDESFAFSMMNAYARKVIGIVIVLFINFILNCCTNSSLPLFLFSVLLFPIFYLLPFSHDFLEALERESLELKKKKVDDWNVGFKLAVQLCFLLNRSKQQYPFFHKKHIHDIFNQENHEVNKKTAKNKSGRTSGRLEEAICSLNTPSFKKKYNDEISSSAGNRKNKNENESEVKILNCISHSFFPFISLRGHCWRRVIINLQHLKSSNEELQCIVSIRILIGISFLVKYFEFISISSALFLNGKFLLVHVLFHLIF